MKKIFVFSLRLFVSAALIMILLYVMRGKYGEISGVLKGTKIWIFCLAFLAFIAAITIASFRLKLIIQASDIPIAFRDALSLTFIGYFFNNFLPTAVGGDIVKAYYLGRNSRDNLGSITSVFVDRVIGLFTMIFIASISLLFAGSQVVERPVRQIVLLITACSIVVLVFATNKNFARKFSFILIMFKPLEKKLKDLYNAIHQYRHRKALIVQSFFISIVSQGFFFLSIGILASSIGTPISMSEILLRIPIINVVSLLPSINGLGLREGAMVVFFSPMIGSENAFAIGILWFLVLFITSMVGGVIYGLNPQFKVKLREVT